MGAVKTSATKTPVGAVPSKGIAPQTTRAVAGLQARLDRRHKGMTLAYVGLVTFILVYCSRPNDWIPGATYVPFAKIAGSMALAGFFLGLLLDPGLVLRLPREAVFLALLFGQLCLAIPFSIWPGGSFEVVFTEFWKIILIALVTTTALTTLARLRTMLALQVLLIGLMAFLAIFGFGWVAVTGTGMQRYGGVLGGIFSNPNDFAFSMAQVFPIAFAFLLATRNIFVKLIWILAMSAMSYMVVMTFSRGGLLALVTALALFIWEFGLKGRRRSLVFLVLFAGAAILIVAGPAGYVERIATIVEPQKDATGSSTSRTHLLSRSVEVTLTNPLYGVGPGNFQILSGFWHDSHNTYTAFSAEAGIPALLLFILLLRQAFVNLRRVRELTEEEEEELRLLAGGLRASLACIVVGGVFFQAAYHFFPYLWIGYASAIHQIAAAKAESRQPASTAAPKPIGKGRLHGRIEQLKTA